MPLSAADLLTGQNKCETEFKDGETTCNALPTTKKRKLCSKKNVDAGTACDKALYCPPVGTKSSNRAGILAKVVDIGRK